MIERKNNTMASRFPHLLVLLLVAGASAFVEVPASAAARWTRAATTATTTTKTTATTTTTHASASASANLFATTTKTTTMDFLPGVSCSGEKIAVVGATGYIGKAVVRESLRRGYATTAVVRPGSNADASMFTTSGSSSNNHNHKQSNVFAPADTNSSGIASATTASATTASSASLCDRDEDRESSLSIRRFDVSDREACLRCRASDDEARDKDEPPLLLFEQGSVDVVVCCLASRNGTPREAFAVDYQASLNVAEAARAAGARRFILLSAYCVKSAELREPHALQFQYAKKKLEVALAEMAAESNNAFDYVSIRPTAFFKSVSGQLETVQAGGPFILFDLGAGKTAACNPISEADLASALIDQVVENTHVNTHWNLGGPDSPGLDKMDQMNMMTRVLDLERQPNLIYVPIGVLHFFVNTFQWLADVFRSDKLNDAAELARIVRYYAIEDMLTTSPDEKYGTTTTRQHYEYIAKNGQEYDPYTSAYGILKDRERILDESAKVSAAAASAASAVVVAAAEVEEKVAMEVV